MSEKHHTKNTNTPTRSAPTPHTPQQIKKKNKPNPTKPPNPTNPKTPTTLASEQRGKNQRGRGLDRRERNPPQQVRRHANAQRPNQGQTAPRTRGHTARRSKLTILQVQCPHEGKVTLVGHPQRFPRCPRQPNQAHDPSGGTAHTKCARGS